MALFSLLECVDGPPKVRIRDLPTFEGIPEASSGRSFGVNECQRKDISTPFDSQSSLKSLSSRFEE